MARPGVEPQQIMQRTDFQNALQVTSMRDLAQLVNGNVNLARGDFPYGPLSPLKEMGTDYEKELGARRWQYPVGQNVWYIPRTNEQVSFDELRNFGELYDIARIGIQVRKEEIQGLDHDWVVREEYEEGADEHYADEITRVKKFWEKPDRKEEFGEWIALLIDDVLVIDALALHLQMTRDGKDIYALRYTDGALIHPIIDNLGEVYGHQQIIYGVPRTAYIDAAYAGLMPDVDKIKTSDIFPAQQLIYKVKVRKARSLYGFPPIEQVVMTINQAIRKQIQDLSYFTDTNVPSGIVGLPDNVTLDQALSFQQDFDALLAGEPRMRARLKFIPGVSGSSVHEFRPFTTDIAYDEFLMKRTLAALGVTPQEIGFTEQINRSTGELQENVQFRRSTIPLTNYFDFGVFNPVTNRFLHAPMIRHSWEISETEDALKEAQTHEIMVRNGRETIDEWRKADGQDAVGIDKPFILAGSQLASLDAFRSQVQPPIEESSANPEMTKQLNQWKENSIKRVKQGKLPRVDFTTTAVPDDVRKQLAKALPQAQSPADVRAVFSEIATDSASRFARAFEKFERALG